MTYVTESMSDPDFLSDYLSVVCSFYREYGTFSSGHLLELTSLVGSELLGSVLRLFDETKTGIVNYTSTKSKRQVVQVERYT